MSTIRLPLAQLVRALERYDDKYDVFDVFADDVEELYTLASGEEPEPALNARLQGNDLLFRAEGKSYRLALTETSGMVRITRVTDSAGQGADQSIDSVGRNVLGRLIGSAIAVATSAKGEGWLPRLFIGVLAGRVVGQPEEHTVTVRYDLPSRQWRAYGGPMSQWLRQAAAS